MAKWPEKPGRDGNGQMLNKVKNMSWWLNGLRSPVGMETLPCLASPKAGIAAKWPEKPGRDGNSIASAPDSLLISGAKWPGEPGRDGNK